MEKGKLVKKIYITNSKYKSYVEIYNKKILNNDTPIIFIHGGPGASLDYMLPISINRFNEPLIFYDQINSGKSSSKYQYNQLNISNFVEQLSSIIRYFKIKKCHLIGHSWGSIIANEYYHKNSDIIKSIIFYSPALDIKLWQQQANLYINKIKENCKNKNCNIDSIYEKKHITDIEVMNKYIKNYNSNIYLHLWGESEFNVNGIIKNYKYRPIEKNNFVLFLAGENDTASPDSLEKLSNLTRGSRVKILKNTRHISHLEEPSYFTDILFNFYNKYYQDTFFNKHEYYNQKILNNTKRTPYVLSNKLIYVFMTHKKNINKLKKLLIKIDEHLKGINIQEDIQSRLDFWYYAKLLGLKDKFKPSEDYLENVIDLLERKDIDSETAVFYYVYIRILVECDSKYSFLEKHFDNLLEQSKKDNILYGYFLTHVILYDLKFSKVKIEDLKDKASVRFAVKELFQLCEKTNILSEENSDLIAEILICFKLCKVKNDRIIYYFYNILNKTKKSDNYHLNVVLGVASFLK